MPSAPHGPHEADRLQSLRRMGVLDSAREPGFDDLTVLASRLCGTPIALVTLIDTDRQWFKSCVGLSVSETHRDSAICAHAILGDGPLVISDTTRDARTMDNVLVTGAPFMRFYAGAPLHDRGGLALGTLCVIDTKPREMSATELDCLVRLARQASTQLERGRSERAITAAMETLRHTGTIARVGAWELDVATNRLEWSDVVYQIHEVEPGTPMSMERAIGFYITESRDRISAAVRAGIEHGTPWDLELEICTAKGRDFSVRVQGEPVFQGGKVVGLRGVFQDVTDRVAAARQLRESMRAAEAASRAKSELLANMSHEIRTPLTAILGFADLLRDDGNLTAAPSSRLQAIDTICTAGQHLLTVINDILDLSKIEADRMAVELAETRVKSLLLEVVSLNRAILAGKCLDLRVRFETPIPDCVMSDPTRLRQILMNLVGNAVKFTERGNVTVSVRAESGGGGGESGDRRLVIDVLDTGPGLTAEQAGKLFLPFSQADTTVTRRYGGSGLGLTICRRLAKLMGGLVTLVRTEPGTGSCFRLDLPLVEVVGAKMAGSVDDSVGVSSGGGELPVLSGRILFAEDGLENQRLVSFYLRRAGAEVETVSNGLVALRMIDEAAREGRTFDLLLTDMQMPEMDGYTLARTLRERASGLAIVALTAHAMQEDRQKCLEAGCDDYATKPIDKRTLLTTCGRWMGKVGGRGWRAVAA